MFKKILFITIFLSFFVSCQSFHKKSHSNLKNKKSCCSMKNISGKASIKPVNKQGPEGFVAFEKVPHKRGFVRVKAEITNLKRNRKFGFHVHEFGDCSSKALKAGGHFSSYHHKSRKRLFKKKKPSLHGSPLSSNKHTGDLGNLSSNSKGKASYNQVLKGHFRSFLGRSVVLHEREDDFTTQPSGQSGPRIACGIIGATINQ